jgi:hypothetical protein
MSSATTRRVAKRSALKRRDAAADSVEEDKENVASTANRRVRNAEAEEEMSPNNKAANKGGKGGNKAKKRVGFVSSQPTEVLTFERDEAPEINLASIVSRSSSRTAARVPISPIASKARREGADSMIIEEVLEWDEDDDEAGGGGVMSCYSLHDLQGEVKITRDTEQMNLSELRRELQARRKSTAGTKTELIQRLNRALKRAKDVEVME